MLWMDTSEGSFLTNNGGVLLADNDTFPGLKKVIEAQGYLCTELAPPGPAARGRLSLLIEEGIELALEKVGAVAPGVGASANVDASISDQLYRARLLEKRGIVVMLPLLEGISNWAGTLDGEDSVTLSWWMQATQERPLGLVIESGNQALKVYPAPVPFAALLRSTTYPPPPPTAPDQASSSETMDLSEPPPAVIASSPESAPEPCDVPASLLATNIEPLGLDGQDLLSETLLATSPDSSDSPEGPDSVDGPDTAHDIHEARTVKLQPTRDILEAARNGELFARTLTTPEPAEPAEPAELTSGRCSEPMAAASDDSAAAASDALAEAVSDVPVDSANDVSANDVSASDVSASDVSASDVSASDDSADALAAVLTSDSVETPRVTAPAADSDGSAADPDDCRAAAPSAERERPASPAMLTLTPSASLPKVARLHKPPKTDAVLDESDAADPFHRMAQREWPNWLRELDSTRGPKPLAVVERTFVSAYTPLKEAWLRNIASPKALAALKTFADSFEHSYAEAFDALRVRGKRPTMVLDIPEIAQRIGRLHGARSIQLVLVDAMRFDVGLRVQDRLRKLAKGQVSLAERLLLWSALPTTTETQLDLIGKGSSGLREPIAAPETPAVVARGKNAATPRRIKAGQRELIKLDVIEAALAEPGKAETGRLDELADAVAEAMADYLLKLPPRTLVMMFGDHGFLLDPVVGGTSAGRSGGASPEEVLVPAFAWLVGNVH